MKRRKRTVWEAALATVVRLREAGHVALLAGGCVRDRLLGRTPKDYDVATDARPERVLELFPRARKVGAKFGVVLTRMYGHDIEVATFRSDGSYSDGRHPDAVTFGTAEEDARRRDFTINGLFYDPIDERVIDYVGGRADLEARILRTIGDPDQRFTEDHLRMLRAVRFAAALGFKIEEKTLYAIRRHAAQLAHISPERVWMELELMLAAPSRATAWSLLVETGLCDHLTPEWKPPPANASIVIGRLAALPEREIDPVLGLAAVLLDSDETTANRVARSLRLSNRQQDALIWLIRSVPPVTTQPDMELADLKTLLANPRWSELVELARADLCAREKDDTPLRTLLARVARIRKEDMAPPPLLTGEDLLAMGATPGPQFGTILKAVYRAQLNETVQTREQAVQWAQRLMQNGSTD